MRRMKAGSTILIHTDRPGVPTMPVNMVPQIVGQMASVIMAMRHVLMNVNMISMLMQVLAVPHASSREEGGTQHNNARS